MAALANFQQILFFHLFLTPRLAGAVSHKKVYRVYPSAKSGPHQILSYLIFGNPCLPCRLQQSRLSVGTHRLPASVLQVPKTPHRSKQGAIHFITPPFHQPRDVGTAFPHIWVQMAQRQNRAYLSGSCGLVVIWATVVFAGQGCALVLGDLLILRSKLF